jgi:hypothetical protein
LYVIEQFFLHSRSHAPALRVGIMINGPELIKPHMAVVDSIQRSDFAKVVVQICPAPQPSPANEPKARPAVRLWRMLSESRKRRQLLFALFERWDSQTHADAAGLFGLEKVQHHTDGAPTVYVSPHRTGFVDRFSPEEVEKIRELKLDVLLRFGFGILRGDILGSARYGVWSFHHGDNTYYRGSPPQFWEMFEESAVSGAMLQVLNESLDNGLVLAKVQTAVAPSLSLMVNRVAPYLTAEPLVIQKLKQLHECGWDAVCASAVPEEPYRGRRKLYRAPTNLEMMQFLGQYARRRVRRSVSRMMGRDAGSCQWRIGIRARKADRAWEGAWDRWRWIKAPAGHYYADPMIWEEAGRTYLFIEDYIEAENRGVIAVSEIDSNGSVGPFERALEQPYHLSFPHLFARDGVVFMLPETKANGRVEIFRSARFPFEWRSERVLLNAPGSDSVLHRHTDNREYLFTSIAHRPGAQAALCLFHADTLWSNWELHPASPMSVDVRVSRNGGPIIIDPELGPIRVSQDNSIIYGRQMHFHRISRLSTSSYTESMVGTRSPDTIPRALGTHTYSSTARFEATDAFMPDRAGWDEF